MVEWLVEAPRQSGPREDGVLRFRLANSSDLLSVTPRRLFIAGYTGRDQAAVARHIAELHTHGIPAPEHTPALYGLTADRLTTARRVSVVGPGTSGEAEFVLLFVGGELFIAVGSDHTTASSNGIPFRARSRCARSRSQGGCGGGARRG
jgi:hypothetical protein